MAEKLAVVAGGGKLPLRLVEAARAAGREVFVIGIQGQVDRELLDAAPSMELPIGSIKRFLEELRRRQIRELVLAGKVVRPGWREMKLDWMAAKVLAKATFKSLGDDGLLQAIFKSLEAEGLRVLAVQDILEDLAAREGVMGRHAPNAAAKADIARGFGVARQLGLADVGQSVVVQQGLVLGVEAVEGTDALIERCGRLLRSGGGGVLVKMRKPQQERRADPPVVGPATVAAAAEAGLTGIAVEAGGVLMLDLKEAVELADKKGLFLIGVQPEA